MSSSRSTARVRTGAAATALLLLAACGGAAEEPETATDGDGFAGQTLTVAAYAGAWGEAFTRAFVEPFEAETGATVELVAGGPPEWLTALRSSGGGEPVYDLVAMTPNVVHSAVSAGVVSEIDTGRIDAFDELSDILVEQSTIDGAQYGVPLSVGATGLAYRTDQLEQAPEDWSDLLDQELCGHIAVSPLTFNAGIEFLAGLVNENGGTLTNPDDVEEAFTQLEGIADCASAFPAEGAIVETTLANGDAWIAAHWDGRAFVQQNNGQPIGFTYPASGSVGALTSFFVAEGTPNEDLAYEFLGYLASSEHQPTFSEGTWYATSNDNNEYPEQFEEQINFGPGAYDDFVWIDYEVIAPRQTELQQRWQEIFG